MAYGLGWWGVCLLVLLFGTGPAQATNETCPRVLARATARAEEFPAERRLAYYAHVFAHERAHYGGFTGKVVDGAFQRIQEAKNPYHPGHYVVTELADEIGRNQALLAFEDLVQSGHSTGRLVQEVRHWVNSADRARYLYQQLDEFKERAGPILEYLRLESEFFRRVLPVRGPPHTLVTYAFEKETRKPEATLMYRHPAYTDEQWLALAPETRKILLVNATHVEKVRLPASVIAPTALKPRSLGGYSQEYSHSGTGLLWEFVHHSYDIDPEQLLANMRDVSGALKERDGFHVHVVFELLKRYAHMPQFSEWVKQLNDYLYLMGLEEGLHHSDLAQLPEAAPPRYSLQWLLERVLPPSRSDSLPALLSDVDYYRFKFFGAAVRAAHYGPSRSPSHQRVAIELRDSTRRMERWERYVAQVGRSVAERVWEERTARRPDEISLTLRVTRADIRRLTEIGLSRAMAKRLARIEPTILIPFLPFESSSYYDYRAKAHRGCPADVAVRVVETRVVFARALLGIERELESVRHEDEDIKAALRMTLSEWAREARVGELFSGV